MTRATPFTEIRLRKGERGFVITPANAPDPGIIPAFFAFDRIEDAAAWLVQHYAPAVALDPAPPLTADPPHGCASEPYRPSNGTEGDIFYGLHCARCARMAAYRRADGGAPACPIYLATMAYQLGDAGYPGEWVRANGRALCTAFEAAAPLPLQEAP